MTQPADATEALLREVRSTSSGRPPTPGECRNRLRSRLLWGRSQAEVEEALRCLAAGKVLILAPNDGNIWAANPFCAVPSPFRVESRKKTYWSICIWDALGIVAALGVDSVIRTACGDYTEPMLLEIAAGKLKRSEGIIHFAVPAHHWWDNIGFT